MILNRLALIIEGLLYYAISLFPNANLSHLDTFTTGYNNFRGYMAQASWIFPVNTFFLFVSVIFVIEFGLVSYRFVKMILGYLSLGYLRE